MMLAPEAWLTGVVVVVAYATLSLLVSPWAVNSTLPPVSRHTARMGWLMLVVWFASGSLMFERRTDPGALVAEGLSTQNMVQLVSVGVVVAWSAWALMTLRVRASHLMRGPGFWITLLGVANLASALWSVWPAFTFYRALEFLAVWVAITAAFSSTRDWRELQLLLLLTIAGGVAGGILSIANTGLADTQLFALLRSNSGAPMAAVYILYILSASGYTARQRVLRLAMAGAVFILFGSTATIVALLFALPILFLGRLRPLMRTAVCFMAVPLLWPLAAWVTALADDPATLEWLARMMNKGSADTLLSATGRVQLWQAIWTDCHDQPFGRGYAAYERIFSVTSEFMTARGGWGASSAHNGYLAAWMGAGWLALTAVVFLFVSLFRAARNAPPELRGFVVAALTLVAVNNLTIQGVGSYVNPVMMLIMALAVLLQQKPNGIAEPTPLADRYQVIATQEGNPDDGPRQEGLIVDTDEAMSSTHG